MVGAIQTKTKERSDNMVDDLYNKLVNDIARDFRNCPFGTGNNCLKDEEIAILSDVIAKAIVKYNNIINQ